MSERVKGAFADVENLIESDIKTFRKEAILAEVEVG